MFVANMYVDVYRSSDVDTEPSEYSDTPATIESLVQTKVPIHITPFRPKFTSNSQTTSHIANTRRNNLLHKGDILRASGRTFMVLSVEPTDGAFMGNSIIYELIEHNAVV